MKSPCVLPLYCGLVIPLAQISAQAAPNTFSGKSLGRISLGFTSAQVHKQLGKPDKTYKLKMDW